MHVNAREYMQASGLSGEQLSKALTTPKSQGIPLPTEPMLFYMEAADDQGKTQLVPNLYIPSHMIDEKYGEKAGNFHAKTVLYFPAGYTAEDVLHSLMNMGSPAHGKVIELFAEITKDHALEGSPATLSLEAPKDPAQTPQAAALNAASSSSSSSSSSSAPQDAPQLAPALQDTLTPDHFTNLVISNSRGQENLTANNIVANQYGDILEGYTLSDAPGKQFRLQNVAGDNNRCFFKF